MSALADQVEQLLAEQDRDGRKFNEALHLSNCALERGDREAAEVFGQVADQIIARIRNRSRQLAELVEQTTTEHTAATLATSSAGG